MKNIVAYYTLNGNTEVVAKEISKLIDGDLRKIEAVNQPSGIGLAWATCSALLGLKTKLKPLDYSVNEYDNVIIGGQVWAGHSSPAINCFIDKTDFTGKKVFIFLTLADDKEPSSVLSSIKRRVEKRGGNVIDIFYIQTQMKSIISPDAVKQPISDWINKNNLKSLIS